MPDQDLFAPDPSKPSAGADTRYHWLVIDGGGLATTAWAANRDLERPEDRIRSSIHVFMSSVADAMRITAPDCRVVSCWDGYDNRKWRRAYHPWYKHGRGSTIDRQEVRVVVQQLDLLLNAMGIATLRVDGHEADDLVASVCMDEAETGGTCLILSDDKDFIQLIDPLVHLKRRSMQGIVLSPSACEMMGMDYGERYLWVKAMAGDPGDNIKGLQGIGEKKAQDAIKAIPDLYESCAEDPCLADWDALPSAVYRAFVRAGRKLVWPPTPLDMDFASSFARARGRRADPPREPSDAECLRAAGMQFIRCLRLVELDDMLEYPPIRFGQRDPDAVAAILRRLDMVDDRDAADWIARISSSSGGTRDDGGAPVDADF